MIRCILNTVKRFKNLLSITKYRWYEADLSKFSTKPEQRTDGYYVFNGTNLPEDATKELSIESIRMWEEISCKNEL